MASSTDFDGATPVVSLTDLDFSVDSSLTEALDELAIVSPQLIRHTQISAHPSHFNSPASVLIFGNSYPVLLDNQCTPRGCIDLDLVRFLGLKFSPKPGLIRLGDGSTRDRTGCLSFPLDFTLTFGNPILPTWTSSHQFEVIKNLGRDGQLKIVLGRPQLLSYSSTLKQQQIPSFMNALLVHDYQSHSDDPALREAVIIFRATFSEHGTGPSAAHPEFEEAVTHQLRDDLADPDLVPVKPRVFSSEDDVVKTAADRAFILSNARLQELWAINEAIDPRSPISYPAAEVKFVLKPGVEPASLSRRQYPIPFKALPFINDSLSIWLKSDIVELISTNSGSICNLPLLAVPKVSQGRVVPDKMRICVDPRIVNSHLQHPDQFEIPNIKAQYQRFKGKRYFGEFDMVDCFLQQPLHEDSRFIASSIGSAQYRWKRAPFGFTPLSSHTQRWVSLLFHDCDFLSPYIDNLFFASDSLDDHLQHAIIILERCNRYNIRLKRSAFKVCETNLFNLGHILNREGISVDPNKVSSVLDWKEPTTGKDMQSFLGTTGFIRNYVRHYGTLAAPLEAVKYSKEITWDDKLRRHFQALKQAVSSCPNLAFADFSLPFYIQVDASNAGCGAVLFQNLDNQSGPPIPTANNVISICSKGFNQTQRSYSIYKKELFGLLYALRQFHNYIFLSPSINVYTDHKPLIFAFTQEKLSPAIQQWIDVLLSYNLTISHIPGYSNNPADALSRQWMDEFKGKKWGFPPNINLVTVKEEIKPELTDQSLRPVYVDRSDPPPVIPPENERLGILELYHKRGHYGRDQLLAQLQYNNITWPNVTSDVDELLKSCIECARFKKVIPSFKTSGYILANRPFKHVEIDLCLSFPYSFNGLRALLVVIDLFSSFTFAIPIEDKSAATVARHLFTLFSTFGWPEKISSDNGTEFTGSIITEMNKFLSIDQRHALPWNPRASGAVEKAVDLVSGVIKKLLRGTTIFWPLYCPAAMSYINSRIHSVTRTSPFEILFNRRFRFPEDAHFSISEDEQTGTLEEWQKFQTKVNEILFPAIFNRIKQNKEARASSVDAARKPVPPTMFAPGSLVFVVDNKKKDKLDSNYVGPYKIVRKDEMGNYELVDHDNAPYLSKVPPDQLKPHFSHSADSSILDMKSDGQGDDTFLHADLSTIKTILNHRSIDGAFQFEYLVHWADGDKTWEPSSRFIDLQCIRDYWEKFLTELSKKKKGKQRDEAESYSRYAVPSFPLNQLLNPIQPQSHSASISEGAGRPSQTASRKENINNSTPITISSSSEAHASTDNSTTPAAPVTPPVPSSMNPAQAKPLYSLDGAYLARLPPTERAEILERISRDIIKNYNIPSGSKRLPQNFEINLSLFLHNNKSGFAVQTVLDSIKAILRSERFLQNQNKQITSDH